MTHSPLPWAVGYLSPDDAPTAVTCDDGTKYHRRHLVAECKTMGLPPKVHAANAEFIVRACNNHDALVAALRAMTAWAMELPCEYLDGDPDTRPQFSADMQEAGRVLAAVSK